MKLRKVVKRPIPIEVVQWDGKEDTLNFLITQWNGTVAVNPDGTLFVRTLEGDVFCSVGDWVARGVEGELYPIRDSILQKSYTDFDAENATK